MELEHPEVEGTVVVPPIASRHMPNGLGKDTPAPLLGSLRYRLELLWERITDLWWSLRHGRV